MSGGTTGEVADSMETYLWIFASAMIIIGVYAMFATLMNLRHFHRLGKASDETSGPLISVVIPARNEEHNLPRLLDSLTAQSYRNIEILVINDQSTDRTGEILEEYRKKDSRIQVFSTDPGRQYHVNGKINALLQLIPHAKGEYILATDADTVHKSDCISFAYSVMKAAEVSSGKCFWPIMSRTGFPRVSGRHSRRHTPDFRMTR